MKLRLQRKSTGILLAGIAALAATAQVHAQSTSWLGDGTSTAWSDPANWDGGVPSAALAQLLFGTAYAASPGGANATTANNDLSGLVLQKITFESGAPAFTLTGNALSLAFSGGNAPQILNLGGSLETFNLGGTLTLDGGAGGFIDVQAVTGDLAFSATTPLALANGGQLRASSGANQVIAFGGAIGGTGSTLVKNGAGTVRLSAANTYSGGTTINDGVLEFSSGGLGSAGTIAFGGGTLRYASGNTQDVAARILNNAAPIRIDTNGNNVTFGALNNSNTGGLIKLGAGTLQFNSGQSYTGDTVVNGGTISVGFSANNGNPVLTGLGNMTVARQVIINAGATLTLSAGNDAFGAYNYFSPVTYVVDGGTFSHGNQFVTINNVQLKNGGTLTGNNGADPRYSGFSILGSVTVSGTGPSFLSTTGSINPGTNLGSEGNPFVTFNIGNTGAAAGDFIVTSPLLWEATAHPSAVLKSGPGTMALNYNAIPNLYPGNTVIDEGRIIINGAINPLTNVLVNDNAGFGRMAAGSLSVNGLALGDHSTLTAFAGPATQTSGSIFVTAADAFTVAGGAGSVTVNVTGGGLTVGQSYALVRFTGGFNGSADTFALGTKPGRIVGDLILDAANGSLDFMVTATDAARWTGTLSGEWSTATLASPKNWVLVSNGTTQTDFLNGDSVYFSDAATTTDLTVNTTDVNVGLMNFDNTTKNYKISGSKSITGGAALTKSGTGTLTITNANSFSGGTTINAGSIEFASGGLGTLGPITFGDNASLRYAPGNTQDIGGRLINSTGAIRIDTNGNDVTFGGAIDGTNTGGFVKNGAGTLTIASNASSFTGDLVINAGTVAVTAGLLLDVPSGTALGNSNVGRQVIVNAGATLEFRQHDVLGNVNANPTLGIQLNGGKLVSVTGSQASGNGPFNILPAITMNGGTLTAANGAFDAVQSLSLKGAITVTGTAPSFITTTGTSALLNGVHLSQVGGNVFDVADVTGNSATDLEVSARLINTSPTLTPASLIKQGAGTMILSNAENAYTGSTTVQAGTLLINGSISPLSNLFVADAAGFGRTAAGTLTIPSVAFFGQATLSAFAAPSTQTAGSIFVSGDSAFTVGGGAGSILVNVYGGGLTMGQSYALIRYTGLFSGDASTFVLGTKPARTLGNLVLNAANNSLDFAVTGTDASRWTGAVSGEWSTAVLTPNKNWVLNSNGTTPTDYLNGDTVYFSDAAGTTDVTLNTENVSPGLVNFDNSSKNYTLSGSKSITGGAVLTKTGTGTLTVSNTNTFTGGVNVNGGTLEFGNGSLGTAGAITFSGDGGKLRYATGNTQDVSGRILNSTAPIRIDTNGNNLTVTSSINATNVGGLIKDGAGTVQINAGQSYSGDTVINAGTVSSAVSANVANPTSTALGNMTVARQVIINAGATLTLSAGNDAFGAYNYFSPVTYVVDGGTFSHGNQFVTINNVQLKNGGTLTGNNGADPRYSGFSILGSVTVSGTGPSFLSTTGSINPGTNLGSEGNPFVTFNIGNTGAAGGDFIVTSPLLWEATAHPSAVLKSGPGTMVLNYNAIPNLYPGNTVIDEGRIIINGAINPLTNVLVNDNAGFGRMAPGPLTVNTLAYSGTGTLDVFASPITQTTGSIVVSSFAGFTIGGGDGAITVNITGSALSAGQTYSLVKFSGDFTGSTSTFTLGTKPAGTVGTLILNALGGSLDFAVTTAATTRWTGAASNQWSTAVLAAPKNFTDGTSPVDYADGSTVFFNDAANTTNVTISAADVSPGSVSFDNTAKDYTVSGSKGITGTGPLTKTGTGVLTLTNLNSFTGGTFLNGGTIVFSDGALGTTGPITFGGGLLRFADGNSADVSGRIANSAAPIKIDTAGQNLTFASAIGADNTGGFVKSGAGTLTLTTAGSSFTGDFVIDAGTVSVTAGLLLNTPVTGALGNPSVARKIIVNAGATLEFRQHDILGNDAAFPAVSIVLNGGRLVSLTGSQASGNGPYNILPALTLNGGTITANNGAAINVQSLSLKGTVTVGGTAPSTIGTAGTPALLDGVHLSEPGGNIFDVSDVTGNAGVDLEISARLINSGISLAANPMLKQGAGTLLLSNPANGFTGPTSVQSGTLLLNGGISGSDVTVYADGTVGGQGTMHSLILSGGTLWPSNPATPGLGIGTLNTVTDALLTGTSHFDLNKSGATLTADLLVSQTQIIYGGTLEVVASGNALAGGDVFNLFDAPVLSGGLFDAVTLPTFADPNLSWDTSKLAVDGTILVVPEPGSVLLLMGGLGALVGFRRRRA